MIPCDVAHKLAGLLCAFVETNVITSIDAGVEYTTPYLTNKY